ncbi:Phospho-2-dehydro-3-deoxyheptonate aldolase, tyrosine-inhibited [Hypsizygus marmoreus]|uniref:Phospho-2-dehydro-3-deoxyheptonate aldolase n=1 Tax=Hypsizygus marmoreus TaxID=39966 RepID=A0A369JXP5_HYPMA|nr:Phospho-2-dehydro-3-deoxyheptonate aldolase, tyrosine-inhibited [Hypsizygus marmoreus]
MASTQKPIKESSKSFRFPVPDEDMYNVSPFPDFDDAEKVQQYIQDRRVIGYDPLVQPALLRHEIVSSINSQKTIASARYGAAQIVAGHDDRLLVVVGPCSIHSTEQALEYAKLLKSKLADWPNLLIIMRAYLQLLCDLTDLGIPVGSELLDTISPQYIADLISWGAIGARTTESQLHRELASGISFPIGFKNGTDGSVTVAIDAMSSASNPHAFMGVTEQGLAAIVKTRGNKDVHVILRGGTKGPNFSSEHVKEAAKIITKKKEWASIMIDCSHGNSQKNHNNQPRVVDDICAQLGSGEKNITGVMIESHINEGRQDVPDEGPQGLKWGVSITDACVDWERTVVMLDKLNEAVSQRRSALIEAGFSRPAAFERAQQAVSN